MDRFVISRELRVACNKEILRFRNKVAELLDRTKWSYLGPNQNTDMLTTLHITRSIYRPAIRLNLNLTLPHWFHEIIFLIHGYNKIPIQCAEEECPSFSFFYLIFRENAYDYSRKRSLDEIQLPLEIYNILKISVRFLIDIIKLYPFIII